MTRFWTLAACLLTPASTVAQETKKQPNVIVIIADDMGHGDLGFHGNPKIKTPNLDKLAKESVRMKNFYVSPVCSPTRSSLLTGRYNYRTGVVDTFVGRSLMYPDEITLAELLLGAGYRTGIFGKWHLGDNFPLRAMDQGFEEALVLKGGGIGQPSDPPGGESYFDPVLQHNGKQVQKKGYCSDVFTESAIDFIGKSRDQPFFVYLAFNAPHDPLQVPDEYHAPYQKMNLAPDMFPDIGHPFKDKFNPEAVAKIYGMVTNIDDNIGKLLAKLDEWKLAENTIVIFLTDNGPQNARYNSGMRGRKGTVFEGGTRVPFFVRWPAQLPGGRDIDRIAAHIDVTPTLLAACGVAPPEKVKIDGKNLLPLWKGEKVDWPDRLLFFQWHRGDTPQMYRAFAVRSQQYRLVQPEGVPEKKGAKILDLKPPDWKYLLFDIEKDPFEKEDIAAKNEELVEEMKLAHLRWFKEMALARAFLPPRIHLGAKEENPVVLTKQDWRGPKAGWGPKDQGHWEVKVVETAKYDITVTVPGDVKAGVVHVQWKVKLLGKRLEAGTSAVTFPGVVLQEGVGRLEAFLGEPGDTRGVRYVEIRRKE
ncbi:MAG: arylsulfatase [Gemmataceae bacterium]|nr:arylsulfatase [Gemmataceae bacterium]MCI0743747.1 arylsulfatase [Gemmataceae bacterium]